MASVSNTTLAARPVKEVYAVSRLVREARGVLEGSFTLIWVEGEISNLATPASGHIYFTLKDEAAQVRCAMFKMRNIQLRFTPKNGMQVLLRVRVTLYEGRGEFQCVVEHMEEAGSGALQRAYEALKHRLGEEGLFNQANKKGLPDLPQSIGVVSSPDGAAVHDILSVLERRFPTAKVVLYPVAVQGEESAKQITEAILLAGKRQEVDVLIISRGGGSLEDLWSFNDEYVARAIFASELPIISAVGHEIDFTIADFVADVRAPTPSVAAEIAVPDSAELLVKIQTYIRTLNGLITHRIKTDTKHVQHLKQRLPQPQTKIRQQIQSLNNLEKQLNRAWLHVINNKRQQLDYWSIRLKYPQAEIAVQQQKVTVFIERVDNTIKQKLQKYQSHLAQQVRALSAVSPLNTLERGYSITTAVETGKVTHKANELEINQQINVRLQHGQLLCEIKEIKYD